MHNLIKVLILMFLLTGLTGMTKSQSLQLTGIDKAGWLRGTSLKLSISPV